MKKFGFGKKKEGRNGSPGPSSNPYAQSVQTADPYAIDTNKYAHYGGEPSAYEKAKQTYAPPGSAAADQRSQQYKGPSPGPGSTQGNSYGPPSTKANSPPPAYGAERYGSGDGYGSNRYDTGSATPSIQSRGAGGYGGLGRSNSVDTTTTEDNRDALFGGAKERQAKKQSLPPANAQPGGGYEDAAAGTGGSGYGAYDDRQLTAEEEEEEDIQATKQQIRFMKQEDMSSTRNALRIAAQAEETGRSTLARLGAQGERIHNTEKNLDLAANHNRVAEEKARELKTLNKSMFAMHVANPFTSSSRKAARDNEIMDKHHMEKEQRDATRQAAFGSNQRMEGTFRELQPGESGYRSKAPTKASLAERSKYQFEADSEDDEMENEIDTNLDALQGAAGRLNLLARATGQEVDEQNRHIERIVTKTDRVDDQIVMNRARLDRIH